MARFFHAIVIGLIGAGIIHIVVLFLIPRMVENDIWTALSEQSQPYSLIGADTLNAQTGIGSSDPFFYDVACLFDLADGPTRVNAAGTIPFWSASIYDRSGLNIFSLNRHTASDGDIDFVIATAAQMIALRNQLPADFTDSIFVETNIDRGIVVLRGFVADPTWEAQVAAFFEGATCTSY